MAGGTVEWDCRAYPGDVPEAGGDKHQGSVSIWEAPNNSGPAVYFAHYSFERIVGLDVPPVLIGKEHVFQRLVDRLEHRRNLADLSSWNNGEDVSVEMYATPLPTSGGTELGDGFDQSHALDGTQPYIQPRTTNLQE
jgi:hypothetical protein